MLETEKKNSPAIVVLSRSNFAASLVRKSLFNRFENECGVSY